MLDEDEFAKNLIPELFKHSNYASFVRQLNMYGFHKRVGLSDNSMKASERKTKSPSEYYNPYFKRGLPNLLWLINKPKSGVTKQKKGRNKADDRAEDSDDDGVEVEESSWTVDGVVPDICQPIGVGCDFELCLFQGLVNSILGCFGDFGGLVGCLFVTLVEVIVQHLFWETLPLFLTLIE